MHKKMQVLFLLRRGVGREARLPPGTCTRRGHDKTNVMNEKEVGGGEQTGDK